MTKARLLSRRARAARAMDLPLPGAPVIITQAGMSDRISSAGVGK